MKDNIKAKDLANELGLNLKIVTSISTFDNYNSFFNIYSEHEEPCRRILILTPSKIIEEVYDLNPSEAINKYTFYDENIWLEEYPLTTNPKNIDLDTIEISKVNAEEIRRLVNNK